MHFGDVSVRVLKVEGPPLLENVTVNLRHERGTGRARFGDSLDETVQKRVVRSLRQWRGCSRRWGR